MHKRVHLVLYEILTLQSIFNVVFLDQGYTFFKSRVEVYDIRLHTPTYV